MILLCMRCWQVYGAHGEIPPICPACERETRWTTLPRVDEPTVKWEVTTNDRRWLKSVKIEAEA